MANISDKHSQKETGATVLISNKGDFQAVKIKKILMSKILQI